MRQFVKNLSSLLYISGRVWFCLKNGLIWRVTFILWLKKLIKHILSNTNDKKRKGKNQNILVIMIIMLAIAVACGRWQVLIRKVVCLILKKKKKVSASLTFQKSSSRVKMIITSTCKQYLTLWPNHQQSNTSEALLKSSFRKAALQVKWRN